MDRQHTYRDNRPRHTTHLDRQHTEKYNTPRKLTHREFQTHLPRQTTHVYTQLMCTHNSCVHTTHVYTQLMYTHKATSSTNYPPETSETCLASILNVNITSTTRWLTSRLLLLLCTCTTHPAADSIVITMAV